MMSNLIINSLVSSSANAAAAKSGAGAFQCATSSLNNNLQNMISSERSDMNSVMHWDQSGAEPGRATHTAELIPMLITSGQYGNVNPQTQKSDMQEAEELCKKLTGEMKEDGVSGFVPSYFKAVGKAYLAIIYLAKINDGKIGANDPITVNGESMTVAAYAIKLSREAYKELSNPSAAANSGSAASNAPVSAAAAARLARRQGTGASAQTGTAAVVQTDSADKPYYLIYLVRITEAKLRDVRKSANKSGIVAGEDSDNAIAGIYEDVMKVNPGSLNITGVNDADIRRKVNGIIWLAALAKLERAAIYMDEQDPAKVQKGIDLLKEALAALEDLDKNKITKADKVDLANKGEKSPLASFDYFRAKMLIADLMVKKAALTGDETLLADANAIYNECAKVTFDTGEYRCYIASWSAISSISEAVSFDQVHLLYEGMVKTAAIEQAIENLASARAKLPKGKYLALQSKLLEANLRLMATRGVSEKSLTLAQEVIDALGGVNDPESKADLEARASLILARAVALKTQNDPDPEDKITTIRSALKLIESSLAAAKRYTSVSGNAKEMDESFYAELYHSSANLKTQLAMALRTAYEDLEDARSTDVAKIASYKTEYNGLINGGTSDFDSALARCASKKNHSKYDLNVRTQIIALEKANFLAFQIPTKRTAAGMETADVRLQKIKNIIDSLKVTLPADAEQNKYVKSLEAKTKLNLLAAKIFLMNSNNMSESDITGAYNEMIKLVSEASKGLTNSEMFFVYQTVLGASMAMLRFPGARANALAQVGAIYDVMKSADAALTFEMADAFSVYATSNITNEKVVAQYVIDSLLKIKKSIADSKMDRSRKNRTLAKVITKVADMQSWIMAKLPGNKLELAVLSQAKKNYDEAVTTYGDTSLLTSAKKAQTELMLALEKDLRRDVLNDADRKTIAAARMKLFKTALDSLWKVVKTAQSPNAMDRGDFGGKDAQAKIMANQWVGIIYFGLAEMLDLKLINGAQIDALINAKDSGITTIVGAAKERFNEAITVYESLKDTSENALSAAQKAELGINIASVYANKANAIATWALNTVDVEQRANTFREVREVIQAGITKAQAEKDKISEGALIIIKANLLYWEGGNVAEAVTEYEKGFIKSTGLSSMAAIAASGNDYLGISFRDLYNYADAKAIASYSNPGIRNEAISLLKTIIRFDKDQSVYSALAYARLGDMVNATTDEQHADLQASIGSFKSAREYFCKALDILTNRKMAADPKNINVGKIIALLAPQENAAGVRKIPKEIMDRNVVEIVSMLMETQARLFLAENRANQIIQAEKLARWKTEKGIMESARDIAIAYMDGGLKLWKEGDNIRDTKDLVDSRIKPSNKDMARRLRKVAIWRAELIYAGCDAGAGINAPEACSMIQSGRDYRDQDRPVNNPEAGY